MITILIQETCSNHLKSIISSYLLENNSNQSILFESNSMEGLSYLLDSYKYEKVILLIGCENLTLSTGLLNYIIDPVIEQKPSIVFISSLITWAGSNSLVVDGNNKSFFKRRPIPSALSLYKFENQIWQYSLLYQFNLRIIGIGLIYGGKGYDFESIFTSIWNGESVVLPNQNTNDYIPMIHSDDLLTKIVSSMGQIKIMVSNGEVNNDNNDSNGDSSSIVSRCEYTLLFDRNVNSIGNIVNKLVFNINEKNETIVTSSETIKTVNSSWKYSFPNKFIVTVDNSNGSNDWNITDRNNYIRMDENISRVWTEFLSSRTFSYQTIVIIGGPYVGKTTLAKRLSAELKIDSLSIRDAINFVLKWEPSDYVFFISLPNRWNNELLSDLRQRVMDTIKAKLSEGKKSKKVDEFIPLDINNLDLSASFIRSFPSELLKEVIKAAIQNTISISRSGFILDIYECGMINSISDIIDMTSEVPNLLIEIQMEDVIVMKRYSNSLNISMDTNVTKLSKENQVALKAFEINVIAYKSKVNKDNLENSNLRPMSNALTIELQNNYPDVMITQLNGSQDLENHIQLIKDLFCHSVDASNNKNDDDDNSNNMADKHLMEEALVNNDLTSDYQRQELSQETNRILSDSLFELEEYLISNVLPAVTRGMIHIRREKPVDPIKFMFEHLYREADTLQSSTESEAYAIFCQLLGDFQSSTLMIDQRSN